MPFSEAQQSHWERDDALFRQIPGAEQLIDWFGFVPSFHDATLVRASFGDRTTEIDLEAFRMTNKVDERGHFVLDRHARVTFKFSDVTAVYIQNEMVTTVLDVAVRRITDPAALPENSTANVGDLEWSFDGVCGGSGSIFAKSLTIQFEPRTSR